MRCKQCKYRLWGVRDRHCPECGTPFTPSEFEFVANSVRFSCPECGQDYYGTGEQGHLVPAAFECVRCHRPTRMDEMVLFPTHGLNEEQTNVERLAWLDRRRVGFVRAWLRMLVMGMVSPGRTMQLTVSDGSLLEAWWFATLTGLIATMGGTIVWLVLPFLLGQMWAANLLAAGAFALIGLVWPTVLVLVWGAAAHVVLALQGGTRQGLSRTYQAMCYASAPNIVMITPCIGPYFAPVALVWWAVSAALMLREAHGTSGKCTAVAVGMLPAVALASLIALSVAVFIPGYRSMMQTVAQTQAGLKQQQNLALIAARLVSIATEDGKAPTHGAELIAAGVPASAFVRSDRPQDLSDVRVAGTTLKDLDTLPPEKKEAIARAAADELPPKVIAHRLGDFVFTHHGIDFTNPHPDLWTVVLVSPQTTGTGRGVVSWAVEVGKAGGGTASLPITSFLQDLVNQNALRAKYGLFPLPDPRGVKADQPIVGP